MSGLESIFIDTESLIQEMTSTQAETLAGGFCQPHEDYPFAYIINITKFMRNQKEQPKSMEGENFSNQKIDSIDNSRKIYINGVPCKGERNIIVIH